MQFSKFILDNYVGHELSKLTSASPPELCGFESKSGSVWLNQLFAIGVFDKYQVPMLTVFNNNLETSTKRYNSARASLDQYITTLPEHNRLKKYRDALMDFESCIIHLAIALKARRKLCELIIPNDKSVSTFDDVDDSVLAINNRIKHFDEDIAKMHAGEIDSFPIYPIWLTNTGVSCQKASVSYHDLCETMLVLISDATDFSETIYSEALERKKSGA